MPTDRMPGKGTEPRRRDHVCYCVGPIGTVSNCDCGHCECPDSREPDPKPEGACEYYDDGVCTVHGLQSCAGEGGTSGGGTVIRPQGPPSWGLQPANHCVNAEAGQPGPPLVAPSEAALLALVEKLIPDGWLGATISSREALQRLRDPVAVALLAAHRQGEEAGRKDGEIAAQVVYESAKASVDAAESRARGAEIGRDIAAEAHLAAEERARTARRDAIENAAQMAYAALMQRGIDPRTRFEVARAIRALAEPTRSGE